MSELVSALADPEESDVEASVRPRRLADFIAQHRVREQLDLLLRGAMGRGTRLCCEPGLVQLCQEPVYLGRDEVADCAGSCRWAQ